MFHLRLRSSRNVRVPVPRNRYRVLCVSQNRVKETMFRHEYHYANLYQLHRVARVKLLPDMARLRERYMTPLALDVINSPTVAAEQVIDFFGTHVLADAIY